MEWLKSVWRGATSGGEENVVKVHRLTLEPTKCWEVMKVKQTVQKVEPIPLDTPVVNGKLRFVCISDTHNMTDMIANSIPMGDVLLHAGDFTMIGSLQEIEHFRDFLGKQPHPHKVVISGNHDLSFDPSFLHGRPDKARKFGLKTETVIEGLEQRGMEKTSQLIDKHCIYLEDSGVTICGVNIYGSPWQPWFWDWAFNLRRGDACLEKWNMIPEGTDVLITHGPPLGHGDKTFDGSRAGCAELLETIQKRVKTKFHVFGHIHEAYGISTDGHTTYINASTCNLRYKPHNAPVIFDVAIPEGYSKEDPFRQLDCKDTGDNSEKIEETEEA